MKQFGLLQDGLVIRLISSMWQVIESSLSSLPNKHNGS